MARPVTPGASKRGAGGRRPASVSAPAAAPAAPSTVVVGGRRRDRMDTYEVAFRLALRHEYYPAGDPTIRFAIEPARETLTALQQRGILIRSEAEGVFVLRSTARRVRQAAADRTEWVALRVDGADEHFASVSDAEGDVDGLTCLHLSNRRPGAPAATVPAIYADRLPLLPRAIEVPIASGETVTVVDMSGASVLTGLLDKDQWRVTIGPAQALVYDERRRQVRLDTRQLDSGRYVVRVGNRQRPAEDRQVIDGLRIDGHHHHMAALIELALAPTEVTEVGEFVFRARRIHWKYHVVSRNGNGPLEGLTIAAGPNTPAGVAVPEFLGPFDERLPNGVSAHHFLSAQPLPLVSRSPVRLRLSGRRQQRMTRDSVLVDCLPVPGKHQLGLLTDQDADRLKIAADADRLCSEMFVYV